jgi:hypothetical protein
VVESTMRRFLAGRFSICFPYCFPLSAKIFVIGILYGEYYLVQKFRKVACGRWKNVLIDRD